MTSQVTAVAVPHDAAEPCQYRLTGKHTLGVLTDLGSITPHVIDTSGIAMACCWNSITMLPC